MTGGAEVRGHRPPKCSADSARRRFVAGDRTGKPGDAPGDGPLFARVPPVGLEKQLDAVVPLGLVVDLIEALNKSKGSNVSRR